MTPKLSAKLLVALSMCYAVAIAIMGLLDWGGVEVFAVIGALVLGLLWVFRGMFLSNRKV